MDERQRQRTATVQGQEEEELPTSIVVTDEFDTSPLGSNHRVRARGRSRSTESGKN